jgi:hypothetical protein
MTPRSVVNQEALACGNSQSRGQRAGVKGSSQEKKGSARPHPNPRAQIAEADQIDDVP